MLKRPLVLLLGLAVLFAVGCGEQNKPPRVKQPEVPPIDPREVKSKSDRLSLEQFGDQDFIRPLQVEDVGGGVVWVVEQQGRIVAMKNGKRQGVVLDVSQETYPLGDQGLLGVAVSPSFKKDGLAYLYMTGKNKRTQLREYRGDALRLDKQSKRTLLSQPAFKRDSDHSGGALRFGPDRMLYLALGDGGGRGDPENNAQNLNTLWGKLIRIDPRGEPYRVPADNPFVGKAGRDEIWALGLRNPWRMSFDGSGRLWLSDVGEMSFEEVNRLSAAQAGANLGWKVYEGTSRFSRQVSAPGAVAPFFSYNHSSGRCSVLGGLVKRSGYLKGRYLYSDTCDGKIRFLQDGRERSTGLKLPMPVSIDEDRQGKVYISSIRGRVYTLEER